MAACNKTLLLRRCRESLGIGTRSVVTAGDILRLSEQQRGASRKARQAMPSHTDSSCHIAFDTTHPYIVSAVTTSPGFLSTPKGVVFSFLFYCVCCHSCTRKGQKDLIEPWMHIQGLIGTHAERPHAAGVTMVGGAPLHGQGAGPQG